MSRRTAGPGRDGDVGVAKAFERHVGVVRDRLVALADASEELVDQWNQTPAADSKAMAELARQRVYAATSPWGEDPVEQAFNASHLLIVGAEDCARAACRVMQGGPTPVFAHISLARSVLEHAGRACLLLDPRISVRLRIARGVNERLNSLWQQERMLPSEAAKENARRRSRQLLDQAERLGFEVIRMREKPRWVDEKRLSSTALVRKLLGSEEDEELGLMLYGYYSAVTHGAMFGLTQSVEPVPHNAVSFPGVRSAVVYTSSQSVCSVLGSMVLALENVYRARSTTFGWNSESLDHAMKDALHATKSALTHSEPTTPPS